MVRTHVPAWCEQRLETYPDGRYIVVCYFTRDGHPVSKARAERVRLTEYSAEGAPLRVEEGTVASYETVDAEVVFTADGFQFSGK